jgi:2-dehydro-3-deoxyphosphogluconate aldolase/(4S)-4-hydroxy-2-oxoglutarate aldolase
MREAIMKEQVKTHRARNIHFMTKEQVCRHIRDIGIVPSIRVGSAEDAFFAADAIISGGIPIMQITMTVPGALDVISALRQRHPDVVVGAGTVLSIAAARQCLDAGAMFISSTGFDAEIVEAAKKEKVAAIPGALTPTEVMAAVKASADMIKIFPCAQVGGAPYIRALRAPFPHVPFIASGGVHQQTVVQFIEAGASALGIGEDLIPREAVRSRRADWIRELAHRFRGMVHGARGGKVPR